MPTEPNKEYSLDLPVQEEISTLPASFEQNFDDENNEAEQKRLRETITQLLERNSTQTSHESHEEGIRLAIETIEQVDYNALREIFETMRRRSGVPEKSGFIEKSGIQFDRNEAGGGRFNGDHIVINPEASIEEKGDEATIRRKALSTLIHEETHASGSHVSPTDLVRGLKEIRSYFTKQPILLDANGYHRRMIEKGTSSLYSSYFSEGVTDMIAERVYGEYVNRTGIRSELTSADGTSSFDECYVDSRAFATSFVEMIAHSVGVPSETVWEGVVQGYMQGLDLKNSGLENAFDEVFYPQFTQAMIAPSETNKMTLSLPEVLAKVKATPLDESARMRVKDSFDKFHKFLFKQSDESQNKGWRRLENQYMARTEEVQNKTEVS